MRKCGLHMVIGKKGAGKSMLGMHYLAGALADTNRIIVTNLPILWTELDTYMREKYAWEGKIRQRIWTIDSDELNDFYLRRGFNWRIPYIDKKAWHAGERPDFRYCYRYKPTFDASDRIPLDELKLKDLKELLAEGIVERAALSNLPRVQYIIDEIQNGFPSREWQQQGPFLLYYLSQQRKLGDDIIAMSQKPKLMDAQLQDLADDWLFIENWGNRTKGKFGINFRLPKRSTWAVYPRIPGQHDTPDITGSFKIDAEGLGSTYDTSAGVGIEGGLAADTEEKTIGFPWQLAVIALIGLICLIPFAPKLVRWAMTKTPRPHTPIATAAAVPTPDKHSVATLLSAHTPLPTMNTSPLLRPQTSPQNAVKLVGLTTVGGIARAFFSDGRIITHTDAPWRGLMREGGRIVGVRLDSGEFRL